MVKLHIKQGDESQFLYEATTDTPIDNLLADITAIYNGRLKVDRICGGELDSRLQSLLVLPPTVTERSTLMAVAKRKKRTMTVSVAMYR